MELTRRNFLKVGEDVFGGTGVLGLARRVAPGQEEENSPTASTLTSKGSR
jgi:hypothetical protein